MQMKASYCLSKLLDIQQTLEQMAKFLFSIKDKIASWGRKRSRESSLEEIFKRAVFRSTELEQAKGIALPPLLNRCLMSQLSTGTFIFYIFLSLATVPPAEVLIINFYYKNICLHLMGPILTATHIKFCRIYFFTGKTPEIFVSRSLFSFL